MTNKYNMYGFTSCPKCGAHYRFTINTDVRTVLCDDCGYKEPVSTENSSDQYRDDVDLSDEERL